MWGATISWSGALTGRRVARGGRAARAVLRGCCLAPCASRCAPMTPRSPHRFVVKAVPLAPVDEHGIASARSLITRHAGHIAAAEGFAAAAARWHDFGVPYEEGQALLGQGRAWPRSASSRGSNATGCSPRGLPAAWRSTGPGGHATVARANGIAVNDSCGDMVGIQTHHQRLLRDLWCHVQQADRIRGSRGPGRPSAHRRLSWRVARRRTSDSSASTSAWRSRMS